MKMDKGRAKSTMATAPAVACMKTLLMVFNFIFWITGIAILALGIWTKVDLYRYMELSSIYYKESPFILIGVGAIIVLVGSLGCCCTVKGNSCLLYMYAVFLVIIFVIELSAGIAGFVYKGELQEGFNEGLDNALQKYGEDEFITDAFDSLQRQLKCCGNKDYTDWFTTPWQISQSNSSVPTSCCKEGVENCRSTGLSVGGNATDINTEGCYLTVVDFMDEKMGLIGGVAFGISFIQVLGAILAYCLAKNINKSKYEQVA